MLFKGSHAANAANGTTGHWVGLERHSNGSLGFIIDDNVTKSETRLSDANAYFDGNWHHAAAVRDFAGKTLTLYIDGKQVSQATGIKTGAIADNNEPLLLGCSDETARPYEGLLDEVIIHPTALSADTVVDAFSGITLRKATGHDAQSITNGIQPGVYVLVIETPGAEMETYKFVKK